tara:strand:+ start:9264 stop:10217 length:954 start_codon:yes stop_codon:yes gene_type:complete
MSNRQLQPYQDAIATAKTHFVKVAEQSVDYDRECVFAGQALMKNDFAMKTANNNPNSVHLAMINVASTGLTLNPANAYAYLVPRDGSIMLDISYKGLIKIATDSGSILWARADIVYSEDTFVYHGPANMPEHQADPFAQNRGEIVGAYCIAKTKDGDILTEVMPMAEIAKIRDKSMSYAKGKSSPWKDWFEQMAKKAVIKRACKTWPYTDRRLDDAIEIANASEGGYDLESKTIEAEEAPERIDDEMAKAINAQLKKGCSDQEQWERVKGAYLQRVGAAFSCKGLQALKEIPASIGAQALEMAEKDAIQRMEAVENA